MNTNTNRPSFVLKKPNIPAKKLKEVYNKKLFDLNDFMLEDNYEQQKELVLELKKRNYKIRDNYIIDKYTKDFMGLDSIMQPLSFTSHNPNYTLINNLKIKKILIVKDFIVFEDDEQQFGVIKEYNGGPEVLISSFFDNYLYFSKNVVQKLAIIHMFKSLKENSYEEVTFEPFNLKIKLLSNPTTKYGELMLYMINRKLFSKILIRNNE
ncbi:MAG TPA: hypothetical protein VMX17_14055 [Candidatus Glassbacteria bacterium]|nr:hypothetical protein [Candidatus Glassbacteria bacterium]